MVLSIIVYRGLCILGSLDRKKPSYQAWLLTQWEPRIHNTNKRLRLERHITWAIKLSGCSMCALNVWAASCPVQSFLKRALHAQIRSIGAGWLACSHVTLIHAFSAAYRMSEHGYKCPCCSLLVTEQGKEMPCFKAHGRDAISQAEPTYSGSDSCLGGDLKGRNGRCEHLCHCSRVIVPKIWGFFPPLLRFHLSKEILGTEWICLFISNHFNAAFLWKKATLKAAYKNIKIKILHKTYKI